MPILFKRTSGWKWLPDSDDTNSGENVLLRADNTISDRIGSRSVRWGSETVYSGLTGDRRVHSTYSAQLQEDKFVFNGVGNELFINGGISYKLPDGTETTADDPNGTMRITPDYVNISSGASEDLAMGDDSYQAFFARGDTTIKFDGKVIHKWGIPAPTVKPTLEAVDALTFTVGDFNVGESSGNDFVVNEAASPTPVYVANYDDSEPSGAMSLTPNSKGRASCTKKWDADTDMLNFSGNLGGQTDLFDIRVWLEEPRKVDRITIMFGLDEGDDPFLDNYYYFDFNIRNNGTVNLKDPNSNAAAAYVAANKKWLSPLSPTEATAVKSPEEAGKILRSIGRFAGLRSRERSDSQAASPAWGHFAVTRGQFNRVGAKKGRDWTTVRGFKVVYTAVPGSDEKIYLDDAIWSGGGLRALTGTFEVGYRWARQVKDENGAEIYTELSPMSPISEPLLMQQQTLRVTIPAVAMISKDEQVNQIWLYMYGGNLDTYYRIAVLAASSNTGMRIDDVSTPNNLSNVFAYWKAGILTSHGFSKTNTTVARVESLTASVYKSEIEAMTDNVIFEPGATGPPPRIISIAGPWNKRMFCLTSEGWLYPSTNTSPSSFSLYHTIDLRMYGTPYWVVKTVSGIFVGCSKDIIRINGTGDNSEDGVTADLWAQPMMVAHPPAGYEMATNGNSVLYRADDGPMIFQGASSNPLPFSGTSLLWHGENRHGVKALNINGRFRFCEYQHKIYMLAPEGDSTDPTSVWRWDENTGEWTRFIYYDSSAAARTILSLHADIDGRLLAGTANGELLRLEYGIGDDSLPVPITIRTPLTEGESPLNRKEAADLQLHVLTGGEEGTLSFYLDRSSDSSKDVKFLTSASGIYRDSVLDLDPFVRLQVGITGSFLKFHLHAIGLTYTPRPNHVFALSLGKIIPVDGDVAWINQVELEVESPVDLYLDIYKNEVLHSSNLVNVVPNIRDVYTVIPPRDTKARRLSLVLRTSNTAGEGSVGFECWMAKVRHASTGTSTELNVNAGDIRSDA